MYNGLIDNLLNKKICILGFGKEGKSTYKFLLDNNITNITVHDKIKQDVPSCVYGDKYLDDLEQYDIIIKSPGVVLKDIDVSKFQDKITSQLELVMEYIPAHIIGITGSKGKSTTTSLIYQMLHDQGYDAYLLGNIGTPLFDDIDKYNSNSYLVVEMAGLQLEYVHKSPHIAIITNLFPEHLDFFGTEDKYYNAKLNIFKYQTKDDYGIYCSSNETLDNLVKSNHYQNKLFKINFVDGDVYLKDNYIYINDRRVYNILDEREIIGKHNLINIMLALKVADILKLDMDKCVDTINHFHSLEHRMQLVGTYNDIIYYDDAIATIPDATINCIEALGKVDTLITGGKNRGIDYQPLIDFLNQSDVTNIICMPESGHQIADKLNKKVYKVDNLEEAVDIARKVTKPHKICLLSPSASSYNQFKNFEEKGLKYQELVKRI